LKNVIDNALDFVTIIKFKNKNQFSEEELGSSKEEYFL
jgi:CRISPR/Cas system-associated endoribonuclease Cas2